MFAPSGVAAAAGKSVKLIGGSLFHTVLLGGQATVVEQINTDGKEEQNSNGSGLISVGTWLLQGSSSDYEVRYDATGDVPTGSAINTWLPCSVNQAWFFTRTALGTDNCTGTLRIRFAGGLELDSVPLTLFCEVAN